MADNIVLDKDALIDSMKINEDDKNIVQNKIQESLPRTTKIKDTPGIILSDMDEMLEFFYNSYNSSISSFAETLDEEFSNYVKDSVQELEDKFKDGNYFDIHVSQSDESSNSIKFNDKTFDEYNSYIITELIAKNTSGNSKKFNNKTYIEVQSDFLDYINTQKINACKTSDNALSLQNKSLDDIKTDLKESIKSDISGIINDAVADAKENIINEINESDFDADTFNGYTQEDYDNHIINDLKVKNSEHADEADDCSKAYSLSKDDLKQEFLDSIDIDSVSFSDKTYKFYDEDNDKSYNFNDYKDYIKDNIKVKNSEHADEADRVAMADNSLLLDDGGDGVTYQNILDEIKDNVKVQNAVNSDYSDKALKIYKTDEDGNEESYDLDSLLDYVSDNATVDKASNSEKFNGYTQEDYDNHIINDLKVKNSEHADEADHSSTSDYASNAENAVNAGTAGNAGSAFSSTKSKYLYYEDSDTNEDVREAGSSFSETLKNYLINLIDSDKSSNLNPSVIPYNFHTNELIENTHLNFKVEYEYDDNGNLVKINHKYVYSDEEDDDGNPILKYETALYENYVYDDNGNLTNIKIYNALEQDDDDNDIKLYSKSIEYNDDGYVVSITIDDII